MDSASDATSLTLDRHLAPAGSAAASFARLWASLWAQPYLSAELLEMCRLTLARLHQNESELRALNPRLGPGALSLPRRACLQAGEAFRSPLFSAAEKSVLLWSAYMLAAEAYTRDLPRAFVSYDGLLTDWRGGPMPCCCWTMG